MTLDPDKGGQLERLANSVTTTLIARAAQIVGIPLIGVFLWGIWTTVGQTHDATVTLTTQQAGVERRLQMLETAVYGGRAQLPPIRQRVPSGEE